MEEKFKRYLPLGSVVLMIGAKKRVMVTGYAVKSPDFGDRVFDYIGCLYPEGLIASDKNLIFDHKDIYQVFALGYVDEEQREFMRKLDEATLAREKETNKESNDDSTSADVDVVM